MAEDLKEREIVVSRVMDAPRERVFKAWTDPARVARWWGPQGFTTTIHEMEVKPGGVWQFVMHGPDGVDYPNRITFDEVSEPERIVYTHGADEGDDFKPFRTTVTFEARGSKTNLTLRMLFATAAERQRNVDEFGAVEGGKSTLAHLAEYLAEERPKALTITRLFDAPRERVWQAWTNPEKLMRWWGPKGFTSPVCKIDFREGGKYLYSMLSPEYNDGQAIWGTGTYNEIVPLERIVYTDSFADAEGNVVPASHYGMTGFPMELEVTVTFEDDKDGKTKLTLTHVGVPAGEISDQNSVGWNESFDKLADSLR